MGYNLTELMKDAWLFTHKGKRFFPLEPTQDMIDIEDIAHALAREGRFGNHTAKLYTVAQHAVIMSYLVSPENQLWALHHDDSEAYLCDIPRPLKMLPIFETYASIEDRLMRVICDKFNLPHEMPEEVANMDRALCSAEAKCLFANAIPPEWKVTVPPVDIVIKRCWSPEEAEVLFLERHRELVENDRATSGVEAISLLL